VSDSIDSQDKALGQRLLEIVVTVPAAWAGP